jgi:hypothetical protein
MYQISIEGIRGDMEATNTNTITNATKKYATTTTIANSTNEEKSTIQREEKEKIG